MSFCLQQHYIFSLARFKKRMVRQEGEVLVFEKERIRVSKGGEMVVEIPFSEIKQITFYSHLSPLPEITQLFGIGAFMKDEYQFLIDTNDKLFDYSLEMDARYRKNELRALFEELYKSEISFSEKGRLGRTFFLFKSVDSEEFKGKYEALRKAD